MHSESIYRMIHMHSESIFPMGENVNKNRTGGRDELSPARRDRMPTKAHRLSGWSTLGAVGLMASLSACTATSTALGPAQQQMLDNSLKVSAAALETGQPVAAGRLYEQLSDTFPSAPEPKLGLAYMALHTGDFATADTLFLEAGALATQPALKAEALLGAGRASLGREDLAGAKAHFLTAVDVAESTQQVQSWIRNGLAVVATLESDYALAEQRYHEALALVSHPRISANLTRMLVEANRLDEARQLFASHDASYWTESDRTELSRLLNQHDSSGTQR